MLWCQRLSKISTPIYYLQLHTFKPQLHNLYQTFLNRSKKLGSEHNERWWIHWLLRIIHGPTSENWGPEANVPGIWNIYCASRQWKKFFGLIKWHSIQLLHISRVQGLLSKAKYRKISGFKGFQYLLHHRKKQHSTFLQLLFDRLTTFIKSKSDNSIPIYLGMRY